MKKLILLFLFSLIFQFDMYAVPIINGTTNCVTGQEYTYTTSSQLSNLSWIVSNGTIVGGSSGSAVRIRWNNGVTSGKVSVSGSYKLNGNDIWETGVKNVIITPIEPTITNLNISTSGTLENYSIIELRLNYNADAAASGLSSNVTWTINNAGSVKTFTGNPVNVKLENPGSTTITAKLKYSGLSKEYSVTKTINLATGKNLETPTITSMSGPAMLPVGVEGSFNVSCNLSFLNIEFRWTNGMTTWTLPNKSFSCMFASAGNYTVSCTAVNSKTGKSGNTITKSVKITGNGPVVRNLSIPIDSYQIINHGDALSILKVENEIEYVQTDNNKQIAYQINNLLTGTLADQGKVVNGNIIDISKLPKGIYVVTLDDGTVKEAHKISVK